MKVLLAALLIVWLGVCRAFAGPVVKVGSDSFDPTIPLMTKTEKAAYNARTRSKMDSFLIKTQNAIAPYQPGCFYSAAECDVVASPACRDAYMNLYSKPVLDFRVTIGYSDRKTEVEDGPNRAAWIDRLTSRCAPNQVGTCGFKAIDDELLEKTVDGPDDKPHLVRLRIMRSSAGVDDNENRGPLKAVQDKSSERAKKNFFGGLAGADVVIYAGHARKGGGASFSPPARAVGSHLYEGVNYQAAEYRDKISEQEMLETLRANAHPPKFIGMFACDATNYFESKIREASKNKSGVAASSGVTPSEVSMSQAFAALDSLLAERCQNEFEKALRTVHSWYDQVAKLPTFVGFFGDAPNSPDPLAPLAPKPGENAIVPPQERTSSDLTNGQMIHPADGGASKQPSTAEGAR